MRRLALYKAKKDDLTETPLSDGNLFRGVLLGYKMPNVREIQTAGLVNPDGTAYVGDVSFQLLAPVADSAGTAMPTTSTVTTTSAGLFPSGTSLMVPATAGMFAQYYIELVNLGYAFRASLEDGVSPIDFDTLIPS